MKAIKYLNILLATVLASTGTGCSDWLDYTPADKQTFDQQFTSADGFRTNVNGVYNLLSGDDLYGKNLSYGIIEAMGMCYDIPESNQEMTAFKNADYTSTTAASALSTIWSGAYRTILNINLILKALDEHSDVLTPRDATLIRGEMLGLRGFIHLDLVRLFGPVVIKNPDGLSVPFADSPEVTNRERLSASYIIRDKIMPDLNESLRLLGEVDPILREGVCATDDVVNGNWLRYRQERMNYFAVALTKARAALWVGDFQDALDAALLITDNASTGSIFPQIDPSTLLGNNTNPDRAFSCESLFGLYNATFKEIYTYNFSGELTSGSVLRPRDGYVEYELFSSTTDYRRQSQWRKSKSSSFTGLEFNKYAGIYTDGDNPEFMSTHFPIMHLAEAYYIAAESHAMLDHPTVAMGYLNTVRSARGLMPFGENDYIDLIEEINFEYLRELRGEGQIFFLHKRNNRSFAYEYKFNGADESWEDIPAIEIRYNVPVPSEEIN